MKYCQGPKCHEYRTKDRIRGSKGDKHYETRRRTSMYYGNGNFCSLHCQNDWFNKFGDMAINHFGRLHEPKRQDASGAWYKDYDWRANADDSHRYFFVNKITKEQRPLTEEQFRDSNYTLNER